MVYFVQCSVPSIVYRYGRDSVVNNPVNLALCRSLSKSRYHWYPDNVGKPSILFNGCDTEWVFKSEAERDAEFDRLASIKAVPENRPD
jgi:hypothetical protein